MKTSSEDTPKFSISAASIESISWSAIEDVTVLVMWNVAIKPVVEGIELGTPVVGDVIGCNVGLAVTNAAQWMKTKVNKSKKVKQII